MPFEDVGGRTGDPGGLLASRGHCARLGGGSGVTTNQHPAMFDRREDGPTLDHVPEWYAEQWLFCACGWRDVMPQIFRDDGKGGDGELIDGPENSRCPKCNSVLSGNVRVSFLDEPGMIFIWDEMSECT